jgi:hypothetical protein
MNGALDSKTSLAFRASSRAQRNRLQRQPSPFTHNTQHTHTHTHTKHTHTHRNAHTHIANRPCPGLGLKAAWKGAELFGDAAAALAGGRGPAAGAADAAPAPPSATEPAGPRPLEDVVASIRADYDLDYFISGAAAMDAYADDCRYSDDFAAFGGPGATARFQKNVSNLGSLL